jgi:hypothetical protein
VHVSLGSTFAAGLLTRNYATKETGRCRGGIIMAIKREIIEPKPGDKRYARRDNDGQFTENQASVGKSLAADRRKNAKRVVPKGQGDKGDQKKRG